MSEQSGRQQFPRTVTVEFGDDHCRTITLNVFRLQVRGRFSLRTLASRPEGARDVGTAMSQMPDVPGLRCTVDSRAGTYRLWDPLESDKPLLDRINRALRNARLATGGDVTHVPAVENRLDDDQWKTLMLELVDKAENGYCEVVDGELPTREQLAAAKGRRLADPWNSGRKPKYHEELEAWNDRIDAQV